MRTLREFIAERDLRRRARACYQCGVCAGGCPAGRGRSEFNPRRIMEMIVRDQLEEMVQSEMIWLCAACFTCLDRCPQKIEVAELIVRLKNAAAGLGNIPQAEMKKARAIIGGGWSGVPSAKVLKRRAELHLPELGRDIEAADLEILMKIADWEGGLPQAPSRREEQEKITD